jgi:hypothetical protein
MDLTMKLTALPDGRWKASITELPNVLGDIFYIGELDVVRERMKRLIHALSSPHVKIDYVDSHGDVILTLNRIPEAEEEEPCICAGCGPRHFSGFLASMN